MEEKPRERLGEDSTRTRGRGCQRTRKYTVPGSQELKQNLENRDDIHILVLLVILDEVPKVPMSRIFQPCSPWLTARIPWSRPVPRGDEPDDMLAPLVLRQSSNPPEKTALSIINGDVDGIEISSHYIFLEHDALERPKSSVSNSEQSIVNDHILCR